MQYAEKVRKLTGIFSRFFIKKKSCLFFSFLFLVFGVGSFFLFENLAKFETSDEDYWKEDRIPSYWEGIKNGLREGDWLKTAINDKPGVGLALISGAGLPFVPEIKEYVRSGKVGGDWLYRSFKTEWSESINFGLRLPVAIFSLLAFAFLLFLIFHWTHSFLITSFSALFFFLNPFLLGISRILNPDTIFWISSFISFLAFFLCLERRQWRYVFLAGIFFGLAVSSKYTANLLVPIFLITLSIFFVFRFSKRTKGEAQKIFRHVLLQFIVALVLGYAFFAFLMPAVFQEPSLFWKGTVFSPGLTPILPFIAGFFTFLVIDVFLFKSFFMLFLSSFLRVYVRFFLRFLASIFLILILFHLVNAFSGGNFVPIDDIKEITRGELNGEKYNKTLPFPYAQNNGFSLAFIKKVMGQSASTLFSIPSFIFFILIIGLVRILWKGNTSYQEFVFVALIIPWIFFVGGIISGVFVNARYAILIQPFISFLGVMLIVIFKSTSSFGGSITGILFLLGAVISGGFYNILSRKSSSNFTPIEITFVMMNVGAVVFTCISLTEFISGNNLYGYVEPLLKPEAILSVTYLGVLSSIVAFFLVNFMLSNLEATKSSIFGYLTTVISVIA
ncbi:MAG: phospholipid carrier-dependent glycosyltransferase, partial [Candidatus Moranbacteria bacterium]|nr:phospholipid carrier-dependent glycosyltransferase [Candidatus Moranbacteria bacterium]